MIIIQSPKKDTYVTDIQTSSNNALYSNVGQSSTIDIFKVVGENNKTFSRSLYICKDVKKGQIVSEKNVKSVRPGFGLHPKHFESIIGRKFIKNASRGTRLSFELLD